LKGKAYFKSKIANIVEPDFSVLPYNTPFIEFLRKEKEKGRTLYLATASNIRYAESVAEHIGIFEGVIASNDGNNLKGKNKLKACQEISPKFAYAGDSVADFDIFEQAVESHLVNPTRKALAIVNKYPVTKVWQREKMSFKTWLKAIRLHQWLKNLLLFVPLFVSGKYIEVASILEV
jgi:phosphoserine phosphatase